MKPRILAWTAQKCRATVAYRSRGCLYLFSPAKTNSSRMFAYAQAKRAETEDELLQAKQDLRLAA